MCAKRLLCGALRSKHRPGLTKTTANIITNGCFAEWRYIELMGNQLAGHMLEERYWYAYMRIVLV